MDVMTKKRMDISRWLGRLGLFVLLLLLGSGLGAQTPPQTPPVQPQEPAAQGPEEAPQTLHLLVGRSLLISSPARVKRVSISDPTIADANVISPNQILLVAKVPGGTTLVIWDEAEQSQTFDVYVDLDILALSQKIREAFPTEQVRIEASKDAVLLLGQASSKAVADKITEVVKAATPKVISLIEVPVAPTKGEILLEVKFAEINRQALKQIGVNLFSTGAASTLGSTTTGQFGGFPQVNIGDSFGVRADPFPEIPVPAAGPSQDVFQVQELISDVLNIFLFRPDIHVGAVVKALKQRNLLQILAEPNLITQTGKEASFLAGGEFPVLTPQPTGAGGVIVFTVQYKEFGVRLTFTPTLTEDGKIHLKVKPEVSALDFSNTATVAGTVIPAFSTRRVETEMDLSDGQSFAIAGLVDDRVTKVMSKIPGLGDIPILGHLFRSWSTSKSKTELLVLVTPRMVKPLEPGRAPAGPKFPEPFLPPADKEAAKPTSK